MLLAPTSSNVYPKGYPNGNISYLLYNLSETLCMEWKSLICLLQNWTRNIMIAFSFQFKNLSSLPKNWLSPIWCQSMTLALSGGPIGNCPRHRYLDWSKPPNLISIFELARKYVEYMGDHNGICSGRFLSRVLCYIGYTSETHLQLKYRDNSFVHNIRFCCLIVSNCA